MKASGPPEISGPYPKLAGPYLMSDIFKARKDCFNFCRSRTMELVYTRSGADAARQELIQLVHLHDDWRDTAWSTQVPAPNVWIYWRLKRDRLVLSMTELLGLSRQGLFTILLCFGFCVLGYILFRPRNNGSPGSSPLQLLPAPSASDNSSALTLNLTVGIQNTVNKTAQISQLGLGLTPILLLVRNSLFDIIKARTAVTVSPIVAGRAYFIERFNDLEINANDYYTALNKFDNDVRSTITLLKAHFEFSILEAEQRVDTLLAPSFVSNIVFPSSIAASSICAASLFLLPPTNLIMSGCMASASTLAYTYCLVTPVPWTLCQSARQFSSYLYPTDTDIIALEQSNQVVIGLLSMIKSRYHEDAVSSIRAGGQLLTAFERIASAGPQPAHDTDVAVVPRPLDKLRYLHQAQQDTERIFRDVLIVLDDMERLIFKLDYYASEIRGHAKAQHLHSLGEIINLSPSVNSLSQAASHYEAEKRRAIAD
jgi:hypothetical protein